MEFILLLLGFGLLITGANYIVDSASYMAGYLKIPTLIIGFTIVAFCTSAPELAVSITASIKHQDGLAFGTVVGSNIFNLLIVVGMSGFIKTLYMEKSSIYKEFPFLILSSVLMFILCSDIIFGPSLENILSRTDGVILLIFFWIFMYSLFNVTLKPKSKFMLSETSISLDLDNYGSLSTSAVKDTSSLKATIILVVGVALLIVGSQMVVNGATTIAINWGVTDQLIGLTIIAIGTSLPEFIVAIIAATKGETDIALGNVIGSNAFNLLFILGVSSIISPMHLSSELLTDIIFMILSTAITYIFALRKKDINKFEGISLISIYIVYILYLLS